MKNVKANILKLLGISLVGGLCLGWVASAIAAVPPVGEGFQCGGGAVQFEAVGKPSFLKIRGKGAAPECESNLLAGKVHAKFRFDLRTLDTGIGVRNEHMKDKYLEVGTHPYAELRIENLSLDPKIAAAQAGGKVPFTGVLALHGVEKAVTGEAILGEPGVSPAILAETEIRLSDFGVAIPSYGGITVADLVKIRVEVERLVAKVAPSAAKGPATK